MDYLFNVKYRKKIIVKDFGLHDTQSKQVFFKNRICS